MVAAQQELEALEEERRRIESLEHDRLQPEPAMASEPAEAPEPEAVDAVVTEPEPARADAKPGEAQVVDLAELEEEPPEEPGTPPPEPEPEPEPQPQPRSQPEPEPEPAPAPSPEPEREPAMAGASRQGGIFGAVRAAFGRGGREHVHDFVEAPGGIGISRSICRECGYVSISTHD